MDTTKIDRMIIINTKKDKEKIDIDIKKSEILWNYDYLECYIILYPFSRKINSKNFEFNPFEEYIKEISSLKRSAYINIWSFDKLFWFFMWILAFIVFYFIDSGDLIRVESIFAVFGSYVVFKELWHDIQWMLISMTIGFKLRYEGKPYNYKLNKSTTFMKYSNFAKKMRYWKSAILPIKMDIIEKSNSETLMMMFDIRDVIWVGDSIEKSSHILSISLDKDLQKEFYKAWYLLWVKVSLNKDYMMFKSCKEFYQSYYMGRIWCLDLSLNWKDDSFLYKKTFKLWNIMYSTDSKINSWTNIIDFK